MVKKIGINFAILSKSKNALINYVSLENTFIEKLKFKKKRSLCPDIGRRI